MKYKNIDDDYRDYPNWSLTDKITEAWFRGKGEFSPYIDLSCTSCEDFCEGDVLST